MLTYTADDLENQKTMKMMEFRLNNIGYTI